MEAKAVSAAQQAVWQSTASGGGQRRGAGCASAGNRNRRRAKCYRYGRQRPDVLRIGAPEERLIAKLDVQVSRCAHEINARRAKRRRGVGLREIEESGTRVGRIDDRNIEPAVRGLHGYGGDGRRRW